jgi:hypothetical protein
MSWRKRLEFVRDSHLATLHPDLQLSRKDLVCSKCGHYHGEIWACHARRATAKRMNLTIVGLAMVTVRLNQVIVAPVCDWCGRNNDQALSYEKALVNASHLKESIRRQEVRKYYPKAKKPWRKTA